MKASLLQKIKSSRGDVLAEFVLVFPLYVAVISYCIWLGTLALARSRVMMAERYATWSDGYRQGSTNNATAEGRLKGTMYWDMKDLTGMSLSVSINKSDTKQWSALHSSSVSVSLTAPAWLHGPMSLLDLQNASDTATAVGLTAFGDEQGTAKSLVLTRTGNASRSSSKPDGWGTIAKADFPTAENNSLETKNGAGEYTRWGDYEEWSQ